MVPHQMGLLTQDHLAVVLLKVAGRTQVLIGDHLAIQPPKVANLMVKDRMGAPKGDLMAEDLLARYLTEVEPLVAAQTLKHQTGQLNRDRKVRRPLATAR